MNAAMPGRRSSVEMNGWTALVTGASSGIGEQFAHDLATSGVNLVLTARSTDALETLARGLRSEHPGLTVSVLPCDLSVPDAAEDLVTEIDRAGLVVDLLINNAGFGTHDRVVDEAPSRLDAEIQVNCVALVGLTSRLLPAMLARRRGGVINVASTAAFQPVATMAVYAATKAFVLSFSEALWAETRGTGVRVLALCPGATATRFFASAGAEFMTRGRQTPAPVVRVALHAFLRGSRPTVVSGTKNRVLATGYRFIPRAVMARTSASTVRSH